jgi:SAM-dependent methyltransferase
VISERLLTVVRCPDGHGGLDRREGALVCSVCGRRFAPSGDYLDLRPSDVFAEQTKYLDEALHLDRRHETVSPPLLAAAVRNDMLRTMLAPRPGDRVVDLGCGSGRVLLWNRDLGAYQVGIDVSPFFAGDARSLVDLVLGDLRRLPFGNAVFNKAYALDVIEHLSRPSLAEVLREAARVLEPGGALFIYSHVRKNSPLAYGLRLTNRLAQRLERLGLLDLGQERLRKSDHLNPLADIPDLERVVAESGFRIARIRYYTPIIGGVVENILVRLAERAMVRRAARRKARRAGPEPLQAGGGQPPETNGEFARTVRADAKERIARRGLVYASLVALTWLMKLDVVLLGRVKSGPFFALLVKLEPGAFARRAAGQAPAGSV